MLRLAAVATLALLAGGAAPRRALPPLVFVSRAPLPGAPTAVPGLGPHQRAAAAGGRLLMRASDGAVRALLGAGVAFDVSDPAVAPDGRRVAFAMLAAPGARWRIRVLDTTTGAVSDPWAGARDTLGADDLDPCWLGDSLLAFASTQGRWRAQYADVPSTNLWLARLARGTPTWRLTSERNGAEEPAWDARSGRLLYARWWYNRWRASDASPGVIAAHARGDGARDTVRVDAAAAEADTVANLWQVVSVRPDGTGLRLEASGLDGRLASAGYAPAVLRDGSVVAVAASNLALSPAPGALALHRFAPRLGHMRRFAGAALDEAIGYGSPRGLAAPAACAPAALPDGRVVFSWAPGARGDFGLFVAPARGGAPQPVFDAPGTLELDAAPLVARTTERRSPQVTASAAAPWPPTLADLRAPRATFRFLDRDVFAGSRARRGVGTAPPRVTGARVRFWATVANAASPHGDTAVLVREAPLAGDGSVDARLPAGIPMFEQVVDAGGRGLRSPSGAAHVAGLNAGAPGGEARCVGCHVGHSTLAVPGGR